MTLIQAIFVKGLNPLVLLFSAYLRPCFVSTGFLIFALTSALLPSYAVRCASRSSIPAGIRAYTISCLGFSILAAILQLAYQIYEVVDRPSLKEYADICNSTTIEWLRYSGFTRFRGGDGFYSTQSILPEICAVTSALITTILANMSFASPSDPSSPMPSETEANEVQIVRSPGADSQHLRGKRISAWSYAFRNSSKQLSNVIIIVLAAFVGCIQPSALNFFYFFMFLVVATWWSFYKNWHRESYNVVKKVLISFAFVHIIAIYLYQVPVIVQVIPAEGIVARVLGLSKLYENDCGEWWAYKLNSHLPWTEYVNPLTVLGFYFILIFQFVWTKHSTKRDGFDPNESDRPASSVHEQTTQRQATTSTYVPDYDSTSSSRPRASTATALLDSDDPDVAQLSPSHDAVDSIPMQRMTSKVVDRHKISVMLKGEEAAGFDQSTDRMINLIMFIHEHSYALPLMAIMAWALLYHSIFGLILLVTVCVLWMFSDSRKHAFTIAPVLLFYLEVLLLIQYMCSLNIKNTEIHIPDWAEMMGIVLASSRIDAFVILAIKLLLALPSFLLVYLAFRDRHYRALSEHEQTQQNISYGTFGSPQSPARAYQSSPKSSSYSDNFNRFEEWFSRQLTSLWIFVVFAVLLVVACSGKPVLTSIVFFIIWTSGFLYILISVRLFARIAYLFLFCTIAYTSAVIISLYIYQFPNFPAKWIKWTGISKEWNDDIGLINYASIGDTGSLFTRLIWPLCFYVVTTLQLSFFHGQWYDLVMKTPVVSRREEFLAHSPNDNEAFERDPDEIDVEIPGDLTESPRRMSVSARVRNDPLLQTRVLKQLTDILNNFVEFAWRLTEVYISKIVYIIIAVFVAKNICTLHFPLIVLISLGLCLPNALTGAISIIMCSYLSVLGIFRMVYQLNHIPDLADVNIGGDCNATETFPKWLGLEKNADAWTLLGGLLLSIIGLGAQAVVIYRQRLYRLARGEPEEYKHRVFPKFEIQHFDRSLTDLFKFVIDFGFYKFGLECSIAVMAIDAWVRMDLLGAVMCVWIAFFALSKRIVVRNTWPLFLLYMAILIPLQYALYVGLPEESCIQYPWSTLFGDDPATAKNKYFDIWMGLSNYFVNWPPNNLIADFFVLLVASCQLTVFRREGHDNESIYSDGVYDFKANPYHEFIDEQNSMVDYIKMAIFFYGHWATLIATLVAGIGGTSLFALGYIVLTLILLWQGNNLYIMNKTGTFKKTLAKWHLLVSYTTFTMFAKVALQLSGCVFLEFFHAHNLCILRQLFSIACVNRIIEPDWGRLPIFPDEKTFEQKCPVLAAEASMGFDIMALVFLVFQLRIFNSWYFQQCMLEYRSEVLMGNRGSILKNQLIEMEMNEQKSNQDDKLKVITERTKLIRERYRELQGTGTVFDPKTYGQEVRLRSPRYNEDDPLPGYNPRDSVYSAAKRAGDYYMFNYDPDKDELKEKKLQHPPEIDPEAVEFDRLTPGQVAYTALTRGTDIPATLEAIEGAERIKNAEARMAAAVDEPGPSGEVDLGEESVATAKKPSGVDRLRSIWCLVKKILTNGMDFISAKLNQGSREHRYVSFVLKHEKERMKGNHSQYLSNTTVTLSEVKEMIDNSRILLVNNRNDVTMMEEAQKKQISKRSPIARLLNAIGCYIAANTDFLCYLLAVLAHAFGAGLITLPLPLMVFFWGTLSNPRPSKAFWVTMIAYTEFVIVMKFIFQFTFFEFNRDDKISQEVTNPLTVGKVLGIAQQGYFSLVDVPLLFMLFFHRSTLRKLGLWRDANQQDTFAQDEDEVQEEIIHSRTSSNSPPTDEYSDARDTLGISEATAVTAREGSEEHEDENPAAAAAATKVAPTNSIVRFLLQLVRPKFRYIVDLYPVMFALDVVCFLIIAFGYSGFGEGGSGNVIGDIQKSRIPLTLVVMLIILTLMIVLDRGIYLRKWVYGKLIYQFVQVIFLHIWIFFVLPEITKMPARENKIALSLYMVKCIYLIVSARQIRNGYPKLCAGNLLTHSYGLMNMIFFKIFMVVPFVFELRTAIDWTWTDTSMPLFDFFNMENFYATIYNLKCARVFEANYPSPRGVEKSALVKYLMGLPMILAIILLVWMPLLLFALLNQIGEVSIPTRVRLTISLEGYPPLYQIEAQGDELKPMTQDARKEFEVVLSRRYDIRNPETVKKSRASVAFLNDYGNSDLQIVQFRPDSEIFWPISSETMLAMKEQVLNINSTMKFIVACEFLRPYDNKKKKADTHPGKWSIPLPKDQAARQKIVDAFGGNGSLIIPKSFPSYVLVPSEGEVTYPDPIIATIMYGDGPTNATKNDWFDDLTLNLENTTFERVWSVKSEHPSNYPANLFFNASLTSYDSTKYNLQTVAFVDRAYPSLFAQYLQGGVITMYITVVVVVGRLLRGVFTNSPADIMISEIPNPDHLLRICQDVYLVREARDFFLEQDLFAKLIFLFRSPATLIEWTRYKVKND